MFLGKSKDNIIYIIRNKHLRLINIAKERLLRDGGWAKQRGGANHQNQI
jgi:hypothetical protein